MPTTISFVSAEEHAALATEVRELRELLGAYVQSVDDDVDTATALRITGIKSDKTLRHLRDAGRIVGRKEGKKCLYSRASCIDYKRTNRLGRPALGVTS